MSRNEWKHKHLYVPDQWKEYWSAYPQGYTILESLIDWVHQVNNMADNLNDFYGRLKHFRKEIDVFKKNFGEDLQDEVERTLIDWQASGFLTVVIDAVLQSQMDDLEQRVNEKHDKIDQNQREIHQRINNNQNQLNKLEGSKVSRSELLDGLNRKASYGYVDRELREVAERIADIIVTPGEGITEQEIIDAREGENTLGDNIRKIHEKTKPFFNNLMRDPYFKNTDGNPRVVNGTSEFVEEGLEITGDGAFRNPSLRRTLIFSGDYTDNLLDTYYITTTIKFIDFVPEHFRLGFRDNNLLVDHSKFYNLKVNEWQTFSHVYSPTGNYQWESDFNTAVEAWYSSTDEAYMKKFIIRSVHAINLTELFGKGNEPTKEEMDKIFKYLEASTEDEPTNADIIKSLFMNDIVSDKKPFIFGELSEYYPSPEFEDMSINSDRPLRQFTADEIYQLYDDLWLSYPNRVDRNFLGYGADSNGNDDETLPIYEYVFKPPYTQDNVRGTPFTDPIKALITTGVHGNEKGTVYTTYKMFENMMADEYTPLSPLRLNIEFRVIPLVNPGGFTDVTRNTREGVNANRDFLTSEANEIAITRDWVLKHDDAVLLLDIHNTWMDSFGLTYGVSHQKHMRDIYIGVTRTLAFDWNNKYGHGDNTTEGYTMGSGRGHIYYEGQRTTNIGNAILLETSADDHNRVEYTSEVLERTYGMTTNFLRAFFHWLNNNLD